MGTLNKQLVSVIFGCILTVFALLLISNFFEQSTSRTQPIAPQTQDDDGDDENVFIPDHFEKVQQRAVGVLKERSFHRPAEDVANNADLELLSLLAKNLTIKYRPSYPNLTDLPLKEAYRKLVLEYLAPWSGHHGLPSVKITQRMLATMEYSYKGGGFRVRIHRNKIYFRKLVHWKQTYRTQRMLWYLKLLYEIVNVDKLIPEKILENGIDFVIYVGDGSKVSSDTFTVDAGFPLFSLRTSLIHIDIPIPDPVQHGSNGQYQWTEAGKKIPWAQRREKLMFRGRGSCLKMQADNWHFCNRVRLQQLGQMYPEDIDAGIIQWNQIYKAGKMVTPPATIEEIERTTGIKAVDELDFDNQSYYKYIIDVDGGLGSSRKPGILSSGSVLFATESPWYTYYEPLMQPYRHYIPVDRWFRGIPDLIKWSQKHDAEVKHIMEQGRDFESKFLTVAASKQYMAILLEEYSKLMDKRIIGNESIEVDYCQTMGNRDIEEGPMGCSREWIVYNDRDLPDEMVSDGKLKR